MMESIEHTSYGSDTATDEYLQMLEGVIITFKAPGLLSNKF